MYIRGDGLQESPGNVPTTAGEQGSGSPVKADDLGWSNGGSDYEFVLLVPQEVQFSYILFMQHQITTSHLKAPL